MYKEETNFISYFNRKYSKYFICSYFLLSALKGLSSILGHELPFTLITDIGIIFITIEYFMRNKSNVISRFIIISIFTLIITSLFHSYPMNALSSGIRWQLFYMLAFIVGTSKYFVEEKFFENMLWVVFIVDIIGLYLYLVPPGWYMSYKFQNLDLDYVSNNMMLEMTRLSSFWPYPYWVSYGSACSFYYILCQYFYGRIKTIRAIFFMLFFLFILLLAQQRLPLFFIICATGSLFFYSITNKKYHEFSKGISLIFVLIFIILFSILPLVIDSDIMEFGLKKIEAVFDPSSSDEEGNFLTSRFSFIDYINFNGSLLFGDGLGSYSFNPKAKVLILDNMWLTIFIESGIIGLFIYIYIFLRLVKKGIHRFKYNLFELGILAMFLLAMFGANCLSKNTQHPIVLWLCCGRLYNQIYLQYKKNSYNI